MQAAQEVAPCYIGTLPLELLIYILGFLVDMGGPPDTLRLVSKAWLNTINNTPQLWSRIRNFPTGPKRIKSWIDKSGNHPLRIRSSSSELNSFLSLLLPEAHRWESVWITESFSTALSLFDKPTPRLRELVLRATSFEPDATICTGGRPLLKHVELDVIHLPGDLSFLKDLDTLILQGVTWKREELGMDQLYGVLSACPDLKLLNLNLHYNADEVVRPRLHFPLLTSMEISTWNPSQPRWTSPLLSIIDAPNLLYVDTSFHSWPGVPDPVPEFYGSWLAQIGRTDQQKRYEISIFPNGILVDIFQEQDDRYWREKASLELSCPMPNQESFDTSIAVKMLQLLNANIPVQSSSAMIDICRPKDISYVLEYLMQHKADEAGRKIWPLPTLRSVRFSPVWMRSPLTTDFARARGDTVDITAAESDQPDEHLHKWNPELGMFVQT
ncbi:hypothetical protein FRB90_001526 [Tulasnella sp. 427]|nr:hypothetical protein FRB90_001526 [Tulasnella sp. 427]